MSDKPYTLEGRSVTGRPVPAGQDVAAAPCIFCGRVIKHMNDGGKGWLCGSVEEGEVREYLYCDQPACKPVKAAEKNGIVIWRCGCVADYVENVGTHCHACNCPREKAVPYDTDECPLCGGEHTVFERTAHRRMNCRKTKKVVEYAKGRWKEVTP